MAILRTRRFGLCQNLVAVENARWVRRLLNDFDVRVRDQVLKHHEHNEVAGTPELVDRINSGVRVIPITDASVSSMSTLAYRYVYRVHRPSPSCKSDVCVGLIRGADSASQCFSLSVDRFASKISRCVSRANVPAPARYSRPNATMVFFEAPHRLLDILASIAQRRSVPIAR